MKRCTPSFFSASLAAIVLLHLAPMAVHAQETRGQILGRGNFTSVEVPAEIVLANTALDSMSDVIIQRMISELPPKDGSPIRLSILTSGGKANSNSEVKAEILAGSEGVAQ